MNIQLRRILGGFPLQLTKVYSNVFMLQKSKNEVTKLISGGL